MEFIGDEPSSPGESVPTPSFFGDFAYRSGDGDDGGIYDVATVETANSSTESPLPPKSYPPWAIAMIVIVCSVIIVGTVVGNVLVCMAVSIVRKLRTPSNWLIVSLAVSDLLVALLVMPLAVVYEVRARLRHMLQLFCSFRFINYMLPY